MDENDQQDSEQYEEGTFEEALPMENDGSAPVETGIIDADEAAENPPEKPTSDEPAVEPEPVEPAPANGDDSMGAPDGAVEAAEGPTDPAAAPAPVEGG